MEFYLIVYALDNNKVAINLILIFAVMVLAAVYHDCIDTLPTFNKRGNHRYIMLLPVICVVPAAPSFASSPLTQPLNSPSGPVEQQQEEEGEEEEEDHRPRSVRPPHSH